MSDFQPFVMERMMSKFEQGVDYNLSESGVHPILLEELLAHRPGAIDDLMATDLNYPWVNGSPALRENIAGFYEGVTPENVLVTVGAIEANYIATTTLLSPGDEMVVMLPNYMQIWGVALNHATTVKSFHLREDRGWAPDLEELGSVVGPKTRVIAVCNPNNPTGRVMTLEEMDRIVAIAEGVGAWIIADEVYAGAEREREEVTPSFQSRYDKVVATGSMSKAYGMPGLRLGWAVAPEGILDEMWARHEYIALAATMLSNKLAEIALAPDVRPKILERTRNYIRRGFPVLESWMAAHPGTFSFTAPDAAAIAFMRYSLNVNSTQLVDRLREEQSVLIVPGDHFGVDRCLRISFGLPEDYLSAGLDRIHSLLTRLAA